MKAYESRPPYISLPSLYTIHSKLPPILFPVLDMQLALARNTLGQPWWMKRRNRMLKERAMDPAERVRLP